MKRKRLYILVTIFIFVLAGGFYINGKFNKTPIENIASPSPSLSPLPSPLASPIIFETPTLKPETTEIPNSYLIENVPFQSQAPFANWDELHDEACEEASVILVEWWRKDRGNINAQTMDEEILSLVDWQVKNWGGHQDLTVKETAQMAESFYGLILKPRYDITIEDIKEEIAQGRPVIVPAAGRLLGNPYFRSPGPIYHMVVAIGYNGNQIIVQDVGTKRGDHYVYSEKILFNAIHDWAGSPDNIESGQKAMLVVW